MELIPLDFLWQVDEADELERVVTKGRAGEVIRRGARFRKLGISDVSLVAKTWSSCRKSRKYSRLVKYDEIHPYFMSTFFGEQSPTQKRSSDGNPPNCGGRTGLWGEGFTRPGGEPFWSPKTKLCSLVGNPESMERPFWPFFVWSWTLWVDIRLPWICTKLQKQSHKKEGRLLCIRFCVKNDFVRFRGGHHHHIEMSFLFVVVSVTLCFSPVGRDPPSIPSQKPKNSPNKKRLQGTRRTLAWPCCLDGPWLIWKQP